MLDELIDIIGREATLKLIQRFGGIALYIPHNPTLDHPLSITLGEQASALLASYYGGDYLHLPIGRKWLRQEQRRVIHDLKNQRVASREIALRVGCTERWVRMVLKDYPPESVSISPM